MAQIANALRGGPSVGVANAGQEESPHNLPASIGPGSELVYAASWFMGNSFPGTMISAAGGRYPSALCGRIVLLWTRHCSMSTRASLSSAGTWSKSPCSREMLGCG